MKPAQQRRVPISPISFRDADDKRSGTRLLALIVIVCRQRPAGVRGSLVDRVDSDRIGDVPDSSSAGTRRTDGDGVIHSVLTRPSSACNGSVLYSSAICPNDFENWIPCSLDDWGDAVGRCGGEFFSFFFGHCPFCYVTLKAIHQLFQTQPFSIRPVVVTRRFRPALHQAASAPGRGHCVFIERAEQTRLSFLISAEIVAARRVGVSSKRVFVPTFHWLDGDPFVTGVSPSVPEQYFVKFSLGA